MRKKLSQNENLKYWEDRASRFDGHQSSWWDINMKKMEIKNIIPYLSADDTVLDIGCSNGISTLEIYNAVKCNMHGIDYSRTSIKEARKIKVDGISFEYVDILNFVSKIKYDKTFSIRCLINIMSGADQKKALINIHNLLKDGGVYIMAEAFYGGLKNLNKVRKTFNLKPLKEPAFNNYFRENEFEKFISKYFKILEIKKYASLYYIGTRLFQYLTLDNDPMETDTNLHRFFAQFDYKTKYSGDYSPQKIYILKKI